jgi:hypothetical protein
VWRNNKRFIVGHCTIRTSYLEICLPSCHSVRPAASRSREQAFYWLLRKHRSSVPLLLMISFCLLLWISLLNLLVLVFAIADVCHRTQYYEQVVEGSEWSKCFLLDSHRNLLPFRPARPSFGYQANLPIPYIFIYVAICYLYCHVRNYRSFFILNANWTWLVVHFQHKQLSDQSRNACFVSGIRSSFTESG